MIDKERAKKLLGVGVPAELVASTLGCEPSYISQLMSEDTFREEVITLRVASMTAASERDATADSIEDLLLDKLKNSLDFIHKPADILRTYVAINNAKRRGAGLQHGQTVNNVVVQLTLPLAVQQKFVTNALGEVVEVDGQTMVTMPPAQLLRNLAEQKESTNAIQAEELRRLAARLPSSVLSKLRES